MKKLLSFFLAAMLMSLASVAQNNSKKVYRFNIDEEIAPPASLRVEKAMEEAKNLKSDIIVVHINTFGGTLDDADKIRTAFLQSPVPVYAFIDNNAASAGALISIACDSIYMHSGSSIGAATVVDQTGQVQPDKYQSYMRSLMRTTAESRGRRTDIAEAMVDPDIFVPGVSDSGKVLTFTTTEAIIVSGILIMLIIGGIYFELQQPGIGFPLILALSAAALYFAPLYLDGLATYWEIIIFFIGIVLIILELFVFPGFGVSGVMGIICVVTGLVFSMVGNIGFDFSFVPSAVIANRLMITLLAIAIALPLSIFLGKKLFESSLFGGLALNTTESTSEGFTVASDNEVTLIGAKGTAATILRPAGKVIISGKHYDAVAQLGYIEKDSQVEVVDYVNGSLVVKECV